jgi:hypothetical protein
MMRFFSQMMKAPMAAFVYSMEMFVKTMQGIQRMADQGIDAMVGGIAQSLTDAAHSDIVLTNDPEMQATGDATGDSSETKANKEAKKMKDQDLSGEDTLKLVRYKILFVKRDYEHAFPEKEELVSYDTSGPEWVGLKVAHFMSKLATTKKPEKWREKPYPPEVTGEYIMKIPKEDQKYIKVYFEVLQRWDRQEAEYDKQQVEVLREIRDRIGGVSRKIGPS